MLMLETLSTDEPNINDLSPSGRGLYFADIETAGTVKCWSGVTTRAYFRCQPATNISPQAGTLVANIDEREQKCWCVPLSIQFEGYI